MDVVNVANLGGVVSRGVFSRAVLKNSIFLSLEFNDLEIVSFPDSTKVFADSQLCLLPFVRFAPEIQPILEVRTKNEKNNPIDDENDKERNEM